VLCGLLPHAHLVFGLLTTSLGALEPALFLTIGRCLARLTVENFFGLTTRERLTAGEQLTDLALAIFGFVRFDNGSIGNISFLQWTAEPRHAIAAARWLTGCGFADSERARTVVEEGLPLTRDAGRRLAAAQSDQMHGFPICGMRFRSMRASSSNVREHSRVRLFGIQRFSARIVSTMDIQTAFDTLHQVLALLDRNEITPNAPMLRGTLRDEFALLRDEIDQYVS
jgi:hypothetical protein